MMPRHAFWHLGSALLLVVGLFVLLFIAEAGCSSGAVCYRKTDCSAGTECQRGQCVRQLSPRDASVSDSATGQGLAGADSVDSSQTPDAN